MKKKHTIPTAIAEPISAEQAVVVAVATATSSTNTIPVEVPEGCGPGDSIRVPLVDGKLFDVTVPEGCTEGSVFHVFDPSQQQQPTRIQPPRGPTVQNQSPDNYISDDLELNIKLDNRPVVAPGAESRTIAIQQTERGCCSEGFHGEYQPGKLNMSNEEFYEAIERYEKNGCCGGNKDKVTDGLNKDFRGRNIRFKIESRTSLVISLPDILKGDSGVDDSDTNFLVITQN